MSERSSSQRNIVATSNVVWRTSRASVTCMRRAPRPWGNRPARASPAMLQVGCAVASHRGSARPLTARQLEAIDHRSPCLRVLACAGSGKTEVLARRAVRLLCEGVPPSAIIAFTFTEKAASELKTRIETRAAEADPRFAELPPCGSGMFIGTVHGWALQMIRELGGIYETADAL